MPEKNNQRIKLTKQLLKTSLIKLLKEKSIYNISIRELCENAGINRTTFYKYYGSQFDLLAEMEEDLIALVTDAILSYPNHRERSFTIICQYMEENIDLARLLINNNVDPSFPEKVFVLPQIKEEFAQFIDKEISKNEYEYIFNFLAYGIYQMIRIWLNKENRESPKEFSDLLLRHIEKMG